MQVMTLRNGKGGVQAMTSRNGEEGMQAWLRWNCPTAQQSCWAEQGHWVGDNGQAVNQQRKLDHYCLAFAIQADQTARKQHDGEEQKVRTFWMRKKIGN